MQNVAKSASGPADRSSPNSFSQRKLPRPSSRWKVETAGSSVDDYPCQVGIGDFFNHAVVHTFPPKAIAEYPGAAGPSLDVNHENPIGTRTTPEDVAITIKEMLWFKTRDF